MNPARVETVAAEIAALPIDVAKAEGGRVVRSMAAKRSGREIVAYLICLGHVLIGRGMALVHIDRLAEEAGFVATRVCGSTCGAGAGRLCYDRVYLCRAATAVERFTEIGLASHWRRGRCRWW